MATRSIYTIGHSTHSWEEFLDMLRHFKIEVVADIRAMPGSRKFPQFDQDRLSASLEEAGIHYCHMPDLGGRRKVDKNSKNDRWRNDSFKAYADHMETQTFKKGVAELKTMASKRTTVYMCSEAVWWRCHRSMVSDYLKAEGWIVLHIMALGKATEHSYTQPARIIDGRVSYSDEDPQQ